MPATRPTPAAKTAPVEARTRVECLRQLAQVSPMAAVATVMTASLVVFWLYRYAPGTLLTAWYLPLVVLSAVRIALALRMRSDLDTESAVRWEYRYAATSCATGVSWGALAWMPLEAPGNEPLLVIVLILACILLVSSTTLAASANVLGSFAVGLALPLLARTLTLEPRMALLFFLGLSALCAVLFSAYRTHRRTMIGAMRGRYEISDLLQQQQVIFESAGEGIVFLRPNPEYVVSCNRRFAELFGYPHAAMTGMPPWRWHPNREQWKALVGASLPDIVAGRPYHQALRLQRADGTQFWAEITGMAVSASDLSAGTVWVVSDITATRAAEAALRISEERFRNLVRLSSDLYWEQDAHFRFTHSDGPEDFKRKLPLERIRGKTRWEAAGIDDLTEPAWAAHIAVLERHEAFRDFIYQIQGADGRKFWLSINGSPLFDEHGQFVGYHGTASDITLRVEAEERIRHLAYHDTLTQLPNRRLLADRLDQAVRNASRNGHRVGLLLIDLDGFKRVNDRHGHAAGDRVLEAVASRLRETVRDADTVARMGGDEFVVLLPEISDTRDAVTVAEKIHAIINEPIADGHHTHAVGSSIGISIFPDHGDSAEALLHRADHAMYHGKSRGGKTTRLYETSALN